MYAGDIKARYDTVRRAKWNLDPALHTSRCAIPIALECETTARDDQQTSLRAGSGPKPREGCRNISQNVNLVRFVSFRCRSRVSARALARTHSLFRSVCRAAHSARVFRSNNESALEVRNRSFVLSYGHGMNFYRFVLPSGFEWGSGRVAILRCNTHPTNQRLPLRLVMRILNVCTYIPLAMGGEADFWGTLYGRRRTRRRRRRDLRSEHAEDRYYVCACECHFRFTDRSTDVSKNYCQLRTVGIGLSHLVVGFLLF